MNSFFLLGSLFIAAVNVFAVRSKTRRLEFLSKPAVMIILLAWVFFSGQLSGRLPWFFAGLVFSLIGDVLLVLPRKQFIPGLLAFIFAHMAYIGGFYTGAIPLNLASLLLFSCILLAAGQVYLRISPTLDHSSHEIHKGVLGAYLIAISLMLFSASLTLVRTDWAPGAALLVSIGAALFFLSDILLAWNKFAIPLAQGPILVMVTYHAGQILIVWGAITQFAPLT